MSDREDQNSLNYFAHVETVVDQCLEGIVYDVDKGVEGLKKSSFYMVGRTKINKQCVVDRNEGFESQD